MPDAEAPGPAEPHAPAIAQPSLESALGAIPAFPSRPPGIADALSAACVVALQRTAGNQAVCGYLERMVARAPGPAKTATSTRKRTKRHAASQPTVEYRKSLRPPDSLEPTAETAKAITQSERGRERAMQAAGDLLPAKGHTKPRRKTAASGETSESALSGWKPIPQRRVPLDPAAVAAHATEIGHPLRPHANDQLKQGGFAGKYHASHAEKQQALAQPNAPVGVSEPMCDDCIGYFKREAAFRKHEQVVTDPQVTRVFKTDGTVTEYHRDGSVLEIDARGTVRARPGTSSGRPLTASAQDIASEASSVAGQAKFRPGSAIVDIGLDAIVGIVADLINAKLKQERDRKAIDEGVRALAPQIRAAEEEQFLQPQTEGLRAGGRALFFNVRLRITSKTTIWVAGRGSGSSTGRPSVALESVTISADDIRESGPLVDTALPMVRGTPEYFVEHSQQVTYSRPVPTATEAPKAK